MVPTCSVRGHRVNAGSPSTGRTLIRRVLPQVTQPDNDHGMENRAAIPVLLAVAVITLPACRVGGVRSVEAENDRLRQEMLDKDKKQRELEGEITELKVKLAEACRAQTPLPDDVLHALPRVTSLEVSSLCGFEPTDANVPASAVSVWFETQDGRGRFVQAVGTVTISALILPPKVGDAGPEPQGVAKLTLSPVQLRDAYRSSFTGTHYAAEIKLDQPVERGPGRTPSLLVRIEFHDAITGQDLKAERVISPKTPTPSGAGEPG